MTTPFERLRARREKFHLSAADFVRKFPNRGINETTYNSHERGRASFKKMVDVYADCLNTTPAWLMFGVEPEDREVHLSGDRNLIDTTSNVRKLEPRSTRTEDSRPPETLPIPLGPLDLPVREVRRDHKTGGTILFKGSGARTIERPANLLDSPTAYAFEHRGSEMAPRHKHGECLHATPGRTYIAGDTIVIYLAGEVEEGELFVVRKFVDETKLGLVTGTYDGAEDQTIPFGDFTRCDLVTGSIYKP